MDPFSLIYDATWQLLETFEPFTSLVRVGNRIKFSGPGRSPEKDVVSTSDVPEVRLIPFGFAPALNTASNTSMCVLKLRLDISSGDKRATEVFYPVLWETFRALSRWPEVMYDLLWEETKFVTRAAMLDSPHGISEFDLNRGISGWSALVGFEIHTVFATHLLKES